MGSLVFAQEQTQETQISWTTVDKYKVKETYDNWDTAWIATTGPIYIYLDMGFGFATITNERFDRFILTSLEEPVKKGNRTYSKMTAVDSRGIGCEIRLSVYDDQTKTLMVTYSDVQYEYLMDKETNKGFPDKIFEEPKENKTKSTTTI